MYTGVAALSIFIRGIRSGTPTRPRYNGEIPERPGEGHPLVVDY
jgi:hypothetical protein